MPVVELSSFEKPDADLFREVAGCVSECLDVEMARVWTFWRSLDPSASHLPPWMESHAGGALLHIRCKECYSEAQVGRAVEIVSKIVMERLAIPPEALLTIVDRVLSGQCFSEGTIWKTKSATAGVNSIQLTPVGVVHNERREPIDDNWGNVVSEIELDANLFSPDALLGLSEFSHLECIYFMHRVNPAKIKTGARRPRNLEHLPLTGIFAQRPKGRPNQVGLSVCNILKVEGTIITVMGLDAIDGSPVLDIKPYFVAFAPRGDIVEPDWVREITNNYY